MKKRRQNDLVDPSGNIVIALLAALFSIASIAVGIASFWYYQDYLSITAVVIAILAIIATSFVNISNINSEYKTRSDAIAYWVVVLAVVGLSIATISACMFFRPEIPK